MDAFHTLIGIAMLFGPWVVGGLLGWRFGSTSVRTVAIVGLGLIAAAAGLAAFLLTAPPSAEEACGEDECVRYFGRWLEVTLARAWPVYTAAAWAASAVFFSWARRSNGDRFRRPGVAVWMLVLCGSGLISLFLLTLFVLG